MEIETTMAGLRQRLAERGRGGKIVLVPTMGALHAGHLALVDEARALAGEGGTVVVSIFVNPIQFGPGEDLQRYPRPFEDDCQLCRDHGVDLVFAPAPEEMYAGARSVSITENALSRSLCGATRPGHFDGVCTVVAKLFNLVQPRIAVFGKKDYQQLAVLRRMTCDLNFPVDIHAMETFREADGLAMSSRNVYLTAEQRAQAPALQGALQRARAAFAAGERRGTILLSLVRHHLRQKAPLGRVVYVEAVDMESLERADPLPELALIALAVTFGSTRLIDNVELAASPQR